MTDRLANAQERAIKMMEKVFIECYREGFDDGYKEGQHCGEIDGVMNIQIDEVSYQRGLNDAWECARKFVLSKTCGGLELYEIEKIFDTGNYLEIIKDFSASECIAKIKEYEEKQKQVTRQTIIKSQLLDIINGQKNPVTADEIAEVLKQLKGER